MTFAEANDYVRLKMVDELTYIDQVRTKLQKLSQQDKVNFISPAELAKLDVPASSSNDIAIYYAEGTIVDVSTQSPLNSTQSEIVGSKVVSDLDKLAKDESVKAWCSVSIRAAAAHTPRNRCGAPCSSSRLKSRW